MSLFKSCLIVILLSQSTCAITCHFFRQRKDGVQRSLDTCTGDYCYTYTAPYEIGYDQGCVTGIVLPTQCWTDRSGTLCVCNDTMCNIPENRDVGEVQSRTRCQNNDYTLYNPIYGGTNSRPFNNYNLVHGSSTCDVQGSMRYFGIWYRQDGAMYRGEPFRESGSFRILTGTSGYEFSWTVNWGRERGLFTLFYYGGFYVSNYGAAGLRWFSRCRTEKCNKWSESSVEGLLTGVRCKASNFAYPLGTDSGLDTCEGQMCAIMTSYVKEGNITYLSQFCFSQNSEVAEYLILVGHYSNMNVIDFAIQNFYLCDEDDCNIDVPTAQSSIDKYKRSHGEDYPPKKNPQYVP